MPAEQPIAKSTLAPEPHWYGRSLLAAKTGVRDYMARARTHNAAFLFTGASVLVSFGSMFSAAFTMRWVSVKDMGLWNLARTALPFAMLALAGINNGLSRELPYYFGKSDEKTANRLAGTTVSYVLFACLLVLLSGLGCLLYFRNRDNKLLFAIAAVTGLIILSYYTNYLIVTFRSSKSFQDFSKIKIVEAILTFGTIPLIAYFAYDGMLFRTVFLSGIVLLFMHWMRPVRAVPVWDTKAFFTLLKTGAPIFVFDFLTSNVSNCDRWVLGNYGGLEAVGLFYLATQARDAISVVPNALSEYIYPRMSYMYGKDHDPLHLWRMAVKSSLMVVAFMIPAVIASWFLLPPVVTKLFPKYKDAVVAAQWLLIASIFSGATIGKMAIWSMKDWKTMGLYQVLYSIFLVAGPVSGALLAPKDGNLLIFVSMGMVIAQAAWLPVGGYLVYYATHQRSLNNTQASA